MWVQVLPRKNDCAGPVISAGAGGAANVLRPTAGAVWRGLVAGWPFRAHRRAKGTRVALPARLARRVRRVRGLGMSMGRRGAWALWAGLVVGCSDPQTVFRAAALEISPRSIDFGPTAIGEGK